MLVLVMAQSAKSLQDLAKSFLAIKTETEMMKFLRAIHTPKELEEIPKRLEIVRLLKQGIPQHQIAKQLGVGIATVTRGAKEVKSGNFDGFIN